MANIGMTKYFEVGEFMRKLCKDRKRCNDLAKDSALATKEFGKVLGKDLPKGHKIVVHLDEENVTHVIVPQKKDIEDIEALFKTGITHEKRIWPPEYQLNPLLDISETGDSPRAFSFLLGEYTLRRCKN